MSTDAYALDLRASLTPWNHLAAHSGRGCVQPLPRCITGVGEWFAPPVAARGFALRTALVADGVRLVDDGNRGKGDCGLLWAGGSWFPDRIERHGTYHHGAPGGVRSLAVASRLVPLLDAAGFVLAVTVVNRGAAALDLDLAVEVDPGRPRRHALDSWDYGVPAPAAAPASGAAAGPWQGEGVALALLREGGPCRLAPGAAVTWRLAVVADGAVPGAGGLAGWESATAARWQALLAASLARFPRLEAGPADLRAW
ncbi:MAG: hypothetical protein L6R48_00750, partial [Planctomycetes bacterium]|nr:hypothetical protein [Planctomycetota bacterium]